MAQIHNLNDGNLAKIWEEIRKLKYATNQNRMAIGRGGMNVYDGGAITIENGGLHVTGSATISGTLVADGEIQMTGTFTATGDVNLNGPTEVAGTFTVTGDTTVTGDFTVSGPTSLEGVTTIVGDTTVTGNFDVDGPMTTSGTLSVEGETTLKADLTLTTGKILAGDVTIDPSFLSGSVKFANGTYVAATPNGAQMVRPGVGGGAVTVSATQADIGGGGRAIIVNGVGFYLSGSLPTTSNAPNLFVSEGGMLYKSTA